MAVQICPQLSISQVIFMLFSPLEQFDIIPLLNTFPSNFSFTNASLFLYMNIGVIVFFLNLAVYKSSIVPNYLQCIIESLYEFVQDVSFSALNNNANRFFPFIFVMFFFVLSCNLIGMIPYTFTVTSHLIFTFTLGMVSFIGLNIIGLYKHGLHFFGLFLPPGASLSLALLLVPIEIISYVFRVIALSVRLFANMMAGHTLLKILATFAWKMANIGGIFFLLQFFPLAVIFAITGLELAIAFLQAYVWTILICLYLNDAINLH